VSSRLKSERCAAFSLSRRPRRSAREAIAFVGSRMVIPNGRLPACRSKPPSECPSTCQTPLRNHAIDRGKSFAQPRVADGIWRAHPRPRDCDRQRATARGLHASATIYRRSHLVNSSAVPPSKGSRAVRLPCAAAASGRRRLRIPQRPEATPAPRDAVARRFERRREPHRYATAQQQQSIHR
jgi:hypothetical protein